MLMRRILPRPVPCSGYLVAHGGRLMKCKKYNLTMDRDIVAVLNIQTRRAGLPEEPSMTRSRRKG
jgi:transposase